MRPRAGQLNHTVVFSAPQRIENDMGGFDTLPTVIATLPAQVTGLDGREVMMGRAFEGVSSYRITTRWHAALATATADLTASVDGGPALNVRSISDPEGRRDRLQILADTGSTGGEA